MIPKERNIPKYWYPEATAHPVSQLIFDLDNTLYPASSSLADEMHRRMTGFVARHLDISPETALAVRQAGFRKHGTTLRWLQLETGLTDAGEFLDFVHPSNLHDYLAPRPGMRELLDSLDLPKSILTNAPRSHALRVLRYFGIEDCFSRIFDLEGNAYEGKPHRSAYERCLSGLGIAASEAVFIDDIPEYLATFRSMGGHCILVDETLRNADSPYPVVRSIFELPHIIH
jgi:putative hydrolase of the HAD superfamily